MTALSLTKTALSEVKADAIVIGIARGADGVVLAPGASDVEKAFKRRLLPALTALGATGKAGEASLAGLARFDIDTWFGIFGPAHLPADVTARLNRAFVDALESSELKARLAGLFAESMASSPDRFSAFVRNELGKYEKVVKASGARVE